jgi:3-methyladenine DNA glycosylase/8-oxoguanine DNA glycosylase
MRRYLKLNKKISLEIKPIAPFNFDATVFKPSYYPDPLNIYEIGKYWFAVRLSNKIYGIKMENKGTISRPKVQITVFSRSKPSKDELNNIINELNFRFEFNRNIQEFFQKFKKEKTLSPFLERWRGTHNSCPQSLYGSLMIGIFLQNTVVRRSVQMTKVMLEKYGVKVKFDNKKVYEFWKPEEMAKVPEKELRELKVGYRAKIFIKLSGTFVKKKINEFEMRRLPV